MAKAKIERPSCTDSRLGRIREVGTRGTSIGLALYIQVSRDDRQPMGWRDLYDTYSRSYPDRWAAQFFPPEADLIDEANLYHLFVFEDAPTGVDVRRRWHTSGELSSR